MTTSRSIGKGKGGGRPRAVTPAIVQILTACFNHDFTIEEACSEAKISKVTYYAELKRNPKFLNEMARAQLVPILVAKRTIVTKIQNGDGNLALRFLERRQPERYKLRSDVEVELPPNITVVIPGSKPHPRILPDPKETTMGRP